MTLPSVFTVSTISHALCNPGYHMDDERWIEGMWGVYKTKSAAENAVFNEIISEDVDNYMILYEDDIARDNFGDTEYASMDCREVTRFVIQYKDFGIPVIETIVNICKSEVIDDEPEPHVETQEETVEEEEPEEEPEEYDNFDAVLTRFRKISDHSKDDELHGPWCGAYHTKDPEDCDVCRFVEYFEDNFLFSFIKGECKNVPVSEMFRLFEETEETVFWEQKQKYQNDALEDLWARTGEIEEYMREKEYVEEDDIVHDYIDWIYDDDVWNYQDISVSEAYKRLEEVEAYIRKCQETENDESLIEETSQKSSDSTNVVDIPYEELTPDQSLLRDMKVWNYFGEDDTFNIYNVD